MKKKIYIIFGILLSCFLTSCDDWLDVKSEVEEKEKELFGTYEGFRSALSGCYLSMADRAIYGQKLTMTDIESLACLWDVDSSDEYLPENYYLSSHNYSSDKAQASLKTMYKGLFKVVTQANMVIKHVGMSGDVIPTEAMRAVIEGEAYALRAYCQFDILRMFGQMPQGGGKTVMLPYSNTTELDEKPPYFSFADYVMKLKADLDKAESLLKENDPICQYAFDGIYLPTSSYQGTVTDEFFLNRQFRLNYWAVKALQARVALYLGETDKAHSLAMEIINEKNSDGDTKFVLSGSSDLSTSNNRFALPSETLFMLSQFDLKNYTEPSMIGGLTKEGVTYWKGRYYLVSKDRFDILFEGVITGSDNRYLKVWNKNLKNPFGEIECGIKKYWYEDNADNLSAKHRVIPMLRMSEMYLIAVETASTLEEANSLYKIYMRSHDVLLTEDAFTDLQEIKTKLINEYRRELFAEGQMFFTYKRTNAATILWKQGVVTEDDYVLPLPNTEYNPN